MPASFGSIASASNNAAAASLSLSVPYPTGISAGDQLVLFVGNTSGVTFTNVPSDWDLQKNSASPTTTSRVLCQVFSKLALGSESGSLSLSRPSTSTSNFGAIVRYPNTSVRSVASNFSAAVSTTSATPALPGDADSSDLIVHCYMYGDNALQTASVKPTFTTTNLTSGSWNTRLSLPVGNSTSGSNRDGGMIIADKIGGLTTPTVSANRTGGWTVVTLALTDALSGAQFMPFFTTA